MALVYGQVNQKRRTLTQLAPGRNGPAVVFNYLLDNRQANPRTGWTTAPVQALEHSENPVQILLFKANTVIGNADLVVIRRCYRES